MVKLTIKKSDGSIYWVTHFNTLEEGRRWLDVEMTRPYWDKSYESEFEEQTNPFPAAEPKKPAAKSPEKPKAKGKK